MIWICSSPWLCSKSQWLCVYLNNSFCIELEQTGDHQWPQSMCKGFPCCLLYYWSDCWAGAPTAGSGWGVWWRAPQRHVGVGHWQRSVEWGNQSELHIIYVVGYKVTPVVAEDNTIVLFGGTTLCVYIKPLPQEKIHCNNVSVHMTNFTSIQDRRWQTVCLIYWQINVTFEC